MPSKFCNGHINLLRHYKQLHKYSSKIMNYKKILRYILFALVPAYSYSCQKELVAVEKVVAPKKAGDEVLRLAVALNDHKLLAELVTQYPESVNARDTVGNSLLATACFRNNVKMAQVLLAAGADMYQENAIGTTAVQIIFDSASSEMLKLFLQHKLNVNMRLGVNPDFHNALLKLEVGANLIPALMQASGLDSLSQQEATEWANNKMPLLTYAMNKKNNNLMRLLIEAGADCNAALSQGITPLSYAIEQGSLEQIKLLVKGGADVNKVAVGMSPLQQAIMMADHFAQTERKELFELLIKNGAKIVENGQSKKMSVSDARLVAVKNLKKKTVRQPRVVKKEPDRNSVLQKMAKAIGLNNGDILSTQTALLRKLTQVAKGGQTTALEQSSTEVKSSKKEETVTQANARLAEAHKPSIPATTAPLIAPSRDRSAEKKEEKEKKENASKKNVVSGKLDFLVAKPLDDLADDSGEWHTVESDDHALLKKYAETGVALGSVFITPHTIHRMLANSAENRTFIEGVYKRCPHLKQKKVDLRNIPLADLIALKKKAKPERAEGDRLRYTDGSLTLITDKTGEVFITAYWCDHSK